MSIAKVGGLLAAAVLLAACGREIVPTTTGPSVQPTPTPSAEEQRLDDDFPDLQHIGVAHESTSLDLQAWTSCWAEPGVGEDYCADGMPPDEPPSLGVVTGQVEVTFPHDGWSWSALLRHPTDQCGPIFTVDLEPAGDQRWLLPDSGPIGTYEVDLSGNGPEGDVNVSFAMTTTREGSAPTPRSAFDLFFDDDGMIKIYGPPTLTLTAIAPDAAVEGAELVVVAADGTRHVAALEVLESRDGCSTPGYHSLTDGTDPDVQFEQLDGVEEYGPAPYDISLTLSIDGVEHTADVAFPADVDEETSSMLPSFTPPLPRATAADYAGSFE